MHRLTLIFIALALGIPGAVSATLPAPTNVVASTDSCWGIYVSWDGVAFADSYAVMSPGDTLFTTDLFYRDLSVLPGASVTYNIAGIDTTGFGLFGSAQGTRRDAPPPPASVTASDDSCGVIQIDWLAAADADSYRVFRNGVPQVVIVSPTLSFRDTLSLPGKYEYSVAALNECGQSVTVSDSGGRLEDPPPVPAGLTTSTDRCDGVLLSWSDVAGEDGYYLYRDGTPIDTLPANSISRLDGTSPAGVLLSYQIAAFNTCEPAPSLSPAENGFRNLPAPDGIGVLLATTDLCTGVQLTWGDVDREDGYVIERDSSPIDTVAADAIAYLDVSAVSGIAYTYRVGPFNSCSSGPVYGAGTGGSRAAAAPAAPSVVTASDTSCSLVRLDWTASVDADTYHVYRDNLLIATLLSPTLSLVDTIGSGSYLYGVAAGNSCGLSDSTTATGTVLPGPPVQPSGLVASDTSCAAVFLFWNSSADAADYDVFRDHAFLATVTDTFYQDSPGSGTFTYSVIASNSCGESDTTFDSGTVLPGAPAAPVTLAASDTSCVLVRLDWSVSAGADSYRVYRDNLLLATLPSTALFYEDTIGSGTYVYGVAAGNSCGWSDSTTAAGAVLPGAPAGPSLLTASDDSCSAVFLFWDSSVGADDYKVFRNNLLLATVTDTFYQDSPGAGTYVYGVTATNNCGESDTTFDSGTQPAGAPPQVVIDSVSLDRCDGILVLWSDVSDEEGYYIYRSGLPFDTLAANATSYLDVTAPAGETVAYRVGGFNTCTPAGVLSVAVNGSRLLPPPDAPAGFDASGNDCNGVLLTWTDVIGEDGYVVERDNILIDTLAADLSSWLDTTAVAPVSYTYRIGAFNGCTIAPVMSVSDIGRRQPGAPDSPATVNASDDSCGVVRVEWTASASAESYSVVRDATPIATVGAGQLVFRDTLATAGTYTYGVTAANVCGTSPATTDSGTRLPDAPLLPGSLAATNDSCDGVIITWDDVVGEGGYALYRDGDTLVVLAADVISYTDGSALPGSTYSYQIGAFNFCEPDPVLTTSVTGGRPATTLEVTLLVASSDSCGLVRIAWSGAPNDTAYAVYRGNTFLGLTSSEFYRDTAAPAGTHTYWVAARGACGSSDSISVAGTRPPDAPAAPSILTASEDSCGAVYLVWDLSATADSYAVYREGAFLAGTTGLSLIDTPGEGTFSYGVEAVNGCGVSAMTGDSGTVPAIPSIPAGLVASNDRCDGIELNWNDVTDETGYYVYRGVTVIDTVSAGITTYLDLDAETGIPVVYRVAAFNLCALLPTLSDPAEGARLLPAPDPVTGLIAGTDHCDHIELRWDDVEREDGYSIERDGAPVDTLSAETDFWFDLSALPGASHDYSVIPFNSCPVIGPVDHDTVTGSRLWDTPDSVTSFTASTDSCGLIRLEWITSPKADSILIVRNGIVTIDTIPATTTFYRDTEAIPGNHVYTILAFNQCGTSLAAEAHGTRLPDPPAVPDGIAASLDSCNGIRIDWNDVQDEQGYTIYRDGSLIDSVGAGVNSYFDGGAIPGGTHSYQVAAWNLCEFDPVLSASADGFRLTAPDTVMSLTAVDSCRGVFLLWPDVDLEDGYLVTRDGDSIATLSRDIAGYIDTGVAVNVEHTYQVRPFNACSGGPVFGGPKATGRRLFGPPDPPALVTAGDDECDFVRIEWDISLNATSYDVFRDGAWIDSVGSSELPIFIDAVAPPGTYSYSVAARNSCGSSSRVSDDGRRRAGPGVPQSPNASDNLCDGVLITWDEAIGAENYSVRRDGSLVASGLPFGQLQYLDNGVEGDVQHTYVIEAVNACGTANSTAVIGSRLIGAPQAPSNVVASQNLCNDVKITWSISGPTDDIIGFEIARDTAGGTLYVPLDTVNVGSLEFTDMPAPGAWDYLVRTINQCGASPIDTPARGIRLGPPEAPQFADNDDKEICEGSSAVLTWNAVDLATSYTVFQNGSARPTGSNTSFEFVGTSVGSFVFQVRADGVCGSSGRSDTVHVVVTSLPEPPTSAAATQNECGVVLLSWKRGRDSDTWITIDDGDSLYLGQVESFVDSMPEGGSRSYQFGSYNACDTLAEAFEIVGSAFPLSISEPTAVLATDNRCDTVVVTWSWAGPDDEGVTFQVARYDGVQKKILEIVPAGAEYRVADVPPDGESHQYTVETVSGCAMSDEIANQGRALRKPVKVTWISQDQSTCVSQPFNLTWEVIGNADDYIVFLGGTARDTTSQSSWLAALFEPGDYEFVIRAMNECGLGPMSDSQVVTLTNPPSAPTQVVLDSSACDSVRISWSPQVDSVIVTRSGLAAPVYVGPGDGRAADRPESGATYRIRSFNQCGESEGTTVSIGLPLLSPPAPISVTATNGFCDSVVITWSLPQTNIPTEELSITRTRGGSTSIIVEGLAPSLRRHVDHGGSGEYTYEVVAGNECGVSIPGETSGDVGAFLPSTGRVSIDPVSDTLACVSSSFRLVWSPVDGAESYRIWEGGSDVLIDFVLGETSVDVLAPSQGDQFFQVQAFGECGGGERSELWKVSVAALPGRPLEFRASQELCGEIELEWARSPFPIDGVRVYRSGEAIGFAPYPDTTWSDTDVLAGAEHDYSVQAEGRCGISARSAEVSGTSIPGLDPPVLSGPPSGAAGLPIPVTFSWNPIDEALGYRFEIEHQETGLTVVDTLIPADPSVTVRALELGEPYFWRVATVGDCGPGEPSGWRVFQTLASAPAVLASDPANFSLNVPVDAVIRVTFNLPIDPASLGGAVLRLGNDEIPGTPSLEEGGSRLVFDPVDSLQFNQTYVLFVSELHDVFGRPLGGVAPITFTTVPGKKPVGDLDGDFQRSPADAAYAVDVIIGGLPDGSYDEALLDLNGDGRFTVADLVFLGRLIVNEGVVLLPEGGKRETAPVELRLEPSGDDIYRVTLRADLPFRATGGYWDLIWPERVRLIDGITDGDPASTADIWHSFAGNRLRLLVAAPDGHDLSFSFLVHADRMPESVHVAEFIGTDENGEDRRLAPQTGDRIPVTSTGVILLARNRPNPFNPTTEIRYFLPYPAPVRVEVFDLTGRSVAILVDGPIGSGWQSTVWNGESSEGTESVSGIYFARLTTGATTHTVRMVLIR